MPEGVFQGGGRTGIWRLFLVAVAIASSGDKGAAAMVKSLEFAPPSGLQFPFFFRVVTQVNLDARKVSAPRIS